VGVLFFTDRERWSGRARDLGRSARPARLPGLPGGGGLRRLRPRVARPRALRGEYEARAACACGGPDKVALASADGGLRCPCCGAVYAVHATDGYVDLVPKASVGEVTQYADHEFHERLGVTDAPPVLSARVKAT
jgi:hypothetical protein